MHIREATELDIPIIVDLLKISLGESLMPKSAVYWRWKHIENPFGASPVLLCFEGDMLIGVRAFMRWQWLDNGKIYNAVRAVDTATHPDHQGKGIFKKLTLSLIDTCKKKGIDFVFNTPNGQSKPGYIKMGWEEAGKLPIVVSIRKPLRIVENLLRPFKPPGLSGVANGNLKEILLHRQLPDLIKIQQKTTRIITDMSVAYLKWRYLDVPVVKYITMDESSGHELRWLVFARIKQSRLGKELRITDCFFVDSYAMKSFKKKLESNMKLWDIDFCTISGLSAPSSKIFEMLRAKIPIGPIVTVRPVNKLELSKLRRFKEWSPTIGDLELF